MTSAMRAIAVTISPPAPIPCTARAAISIAMLPASPATAEAPTKTIALTWNTSRRPNRSPNLPASTVETASARMYAVTTQAMWPAPPRSATIVGNAVETMVWSSAASSMPSRIVTNTRFVRDLLSASGRSSAGAVTVLMARTVPSSPLLRSRCWSTAHSTNNKCAKPRQGYGGLLAEPLQDQLAYAGGVGLAAHLLHHDADQGPGGRDLSGSDLVGHVGVVRDRLVDGRTERRVVGHHLESARRDDLLRRSLVREHAVDDLPGELVVEPSGVDHRLDLGHPGRRDRQLSQLDTVRVGPPGELAGPPLASRLRSRSSLDGRLDQRQSAGAGSIAHLEIGEVPRLLQPRPAHRRWLGQRRPQLLDPLARRCDRHQVGLGEVAVVLGFFLAATRGRDAGVLVPVAGLLRHPATVAEHRGLPADLVTQRPLDTAQRVDVLRLGP